MLTVAVIVYDRYMNIVRWIDCWKKCYHNGFDLVVIHNDNGKWKMFRDLCFDNGIKYVRRNNIGYDIGAMQDVFQERLHGFDNNWRYLLWCTDDVVPMQINFIDPFWLNIVKPGVGIAAMQISPEYKAHVRTGCFMIEKKLSKFITFPADPITTKKQCYEFEHRSNNTLTDQIRKIGLSCVQVAPLMKSPMYDTEYWKRNKKVIQQYHLYNREKEHREIFSKQ